MADDNRLPTNQSQLDIANALNGIASALTPQDTIKANSVYPVETSPSTHAYSEGDHLIVAGVTYVAIDDIAIGDSLVLNTNIEAETLATRMNHIEDGIESASTASGTEYSSGVSVADKLDWVFLKNMYLNDTQDISDYSEIIIVPRVAGNQPFNSFHWLKRAMGGAFYICSIEGVNNYYEAHFTLSNNILKIDAVSTAGWGNACNCAVYGKQ